MPSVHCGTFQLAGIRPKVHSRPRDLIGPGTGITASEMLKSAWEIALDKYDEHEQLSHITAELLEHVALLEEGWRAINPPERDEPLDDQRLAA